MPNNSTGWAKVEAASRDGAAPSLNWIYLCLLKEQQRAERLELELSVTRASLVQATSALQETREGQHQALHMASHDALTMLLNRQTFMTHLAKAMACQATGASFLAVLFIDLHHFKRVNDRHGHAIGDWVLQVIATRLAQAVREGDTVARMGGDEFACLLANVATLEQVRSVATKLNGVMAQPIQLGALHLQVMPGMGIATYRQGDSINAIQLLEQADRALSKARLRQCQFAFHNQPEGDESA